MARSAKFKATDGDVEAYLDSISNEQRRADARTLVALLSEITEEPPVLWTAGIIGFGEYRYRYPSGREGVASLAAFAPRKDSLTIYLVGGFEERDHGLLEQLGPHRTGKGCLYLKRLSDVDRDVLAGLVRRSCDVRRGIDRAASR